MAKNLITNILINAKTTDAFNNIAARLLRMGQQINGISSRVMEFEKESVNIYRSYEDNMLAAEFALSAQYKSATKLSQVMDGLDIAAKEWAATTIFHTDDVSAAINTAAHAGWSYEQILLGIPEAMRIAQAGGLDLSEGLDFLVKMLNTTNTSFDDAGQLIDQWAKAANLSATNIEEIGDAFMSLSASAMFADSTQELMTLLAVLANAGVTGSKAGTLLRTAMMRMVGPTKAAQTAMKELGATEEELAEWTEKGATAEQLEQLGFSAYDAAGNLKPMRDIFISLHDSLKGMTEEQRFDILKTMFPLRSINAATAFYNSIEKGNFEELFQAIGDSEGYAASGAEIMMSGLTGAIETLASKWEKFQAALGETLAPGVETMAGHIGHIVDWLNDLDEPTMSALAGALTAISAAGPGMLIAGAGMLLMASPGGRLLLVAAALGAAAGYITALDEAAKRNTFGELAINMGEVKTALKFKKEDVDETIGDLRRFRHAMILTANNYSDFTTALSEDLFTKMATGMEIDPEGAEAKKLQQYGADLYTEVIKGLNTAQAADISLIENISEGDIENPIYQNALALIDNGFSRAQAKAAENSQALRDAMTSAFTDGKLTPEEYGAIQDIINQYNDLMALTDPTNLEYARLMNKKNTVSLESMKGYVSEVSAGRNEYLSAYDKQYEDMLARLRLFYDYSLKYGQDITNPITGESMGQASDIELDTLISMLYGDYLNSRGKQSIKFDQMLMNAFEGAMGRTANGSVWRDVAALMGGGELTQEMYANADALYALLSDQGLFGAVEEITKAMGGPSKIRELAAQYAATEGAEAKELADFFTLLGYLAYDTEGNGYARAMGLLTHNNFRYDELSAEEEAYEADRQRSILEQRLASLESERSDVQARYDAAYARLYNNEGRPWFYQGGADKKNLGIWANQLENFDIEIAELQRQLGITPPVMKVVTEVDDTAVKNYNPGEKTLPVVLLPGGTGGGQTMTKYAEGGRASMASIFGDAGPEWAIPEEHSERTASLLNAAREASGFTWGDLIGRYGGLNAGNGSVTVNYQPVINGGDGAGLAAALAQDRDALVKLVKNAISEAKYRTAVAAY